MVRRWAQTGEGDFARVITFKTEYAQSLIDQFSNPSKLPNMAISVDMLDTGIDIPDVVNLVFFKLVRSKTKFWQMIGRGTRLRDNLFGPGDDKRFFYVFDYCQNLECFSQSLPATNGAAGESLTTRLFKRRLDLITAIDSLDASATTMGSSRVSEASPPYGESVNEQAVRIRRRRARQGQRQPGRREPPRDLRRRQR
jgi:type I restriction enzyme, R subunit